MKRVVVAGGGTAGWIAAYALIKQLAPLIEVLLKTLRAISHASFERLKQGIRN